MGMSWVRPGLSSNFGESMAVFLGLARGPTSELCDHDKLRDLSVLLLLSFVVLGKMPDLSVIPHMRCVILVKLLNLSGLPYLRCVILGSFLTSLGFHF